MTATLFFTSNEINELATPAEYVATVREGCKQRDEGTLAEPRTKPFNREPPSMLATYAAVLSETGAMGGYMYSASFGAEDTWFMTPLFDAQSGGPLTLLDGASMNPFEADTAGSVAVSAFTRDDASTLALIGSGAQARGQLRIAAAVRDLDSVWVYSPTRESRESLAGEIDHTLDTSVATIVSNAAAVEGADIVVMATIATDSVFDGDLLDPGTRVAAMGQYHPKKRELDETAIERVTYVPDLRERATMDVGSFLVAVGTGVVDEGHIHAELGEVVAGVAVGREDREEVTVSDSGGTDIEAVVAAHMFYEKAHGEGPGTTINFSPASGSLARQ